MKGDIRMGAPINLKRIFENEPYKSIVNLLAEYRDGLQLKHIQYVIFENSYLEDYTVRKIKEDIGWKAEDLISSGKVKKYSVKQSKSTKKEEQQDNEGIRIRSNLYNMLKKMMMPPNSVIYRENGKYKLHKSSVNRLVVDSDKKYIDKASKKDTKIVEGGRINIYGFKPVKTDFYKLFLNKKEKENIDRFNMAIEKLREGIGELQSLMDNSIGYYMAYDLVKKHYDDATYPLLDRELFIILCYYDFKEPSLIEKWLDFSNGEIKVLKPDKILVDIFKKHFYPDKKVGEIKSMLKDHVINKETTITLFKHSISPFIKMRSHIVAVIHSGSGHVIDEKERLKGMSQFSKFSNEINKHIEELSVSYKNYEKKYFKNNEEDLRKIKDLALQEAPDAKERIDEMMKQLDEKEKPDIDDFLNLYKKPRVIL